MKSTKKMFVTSLLSMIICVAMLAGTTYAWFTDTASTGVNEIRAGNLDIELMYAKPGDTAWRAVDEETKLFDSKLWEPGYTEVVYLQVRNVGSLALKHALALNVVGESQAENALGEKFKISDYLQVDVKQVDNDIELSNVQRSDLDIDTSVLDPERTMRAFMLEGECLDADEAMTYQLSIYMPTSAGNAVNYKGKIAPSLTFGIKVTATQATAERDSFGNEYDAEAPLFISVKNAKEFERAFSDATVGKDIYVNLENDIDLGAGFVRIVREKHNNQVGVGAKDIVINGNGHSISSAYSGPNGMLGIEYTEAIRSITILNTTIKSNGMAGSGSETRSVAAFEVENGTVNLIGCSIEGADTEHSIGIKLQRSKSLVINIRDCKINAAFPIVVDGSSDCALNVEGGVIASNYSITTDGGAYCIKTVAPSSNVVYSIKRTIFEGENASLHDSTSTQNGCQVQTEDIQNNTKKN